MKHTAFKMYSVLMVLVFSKLVIAREENVLMTEVFEIIIDPPLFNWTYEGKQFCFCFQSLIPFYFRTSRSVRLSTISFKRPGFTILGQLHLF